MSAFSLCNLMTIYHVALLVGAIVAYCISINYYNGIEDEMEIWAWNVYHLGVGVGARDFENRPIDDIAGLGTGAWLLGLFVSALLFDLFLSFFSSFISSWAGFSGTLTTCLISSSRSTAYLGNFSIILSLAG